MRIFSWNKKKKIYKKNNNICSICLEKCNLIFCNNCKNYVHSYCLKNYININYNTVYININNKSVVKCFICKKYKILN